jgi:hypothetical protein
MDELRKTSRGPVCRTPVDEEHVKSLMIGPLLAKGI